CARVVLGPVGRDDPHAAAASRQQAGGRQAATAVVPAPGDHQDGAVAAVLLDQRDQVAGGVLDEYAVVETELAGSKHDELLHLARGDGGDVVPAGLREAHAYPFADAAAQGDGREVGGGVDVLHAVGGVERLHER